jgi:hypothetical protein
MIALQGFNGTFPDSYPREIVLIELAMARKLASACANRDVFARWVAPPLLFLAGAFSEGVIGAYAERALDLLEKILSG